MKFIPQVLHCSLSVFRCILFTDIYNNIRLFHTYTLPIYYIHVHINIIIRTAYIVNTMCIILCYIIEYSMLGHSKQTSYKQFVSLINYVLDNCFLIYAWLLQFLVSFMSSSVWYEVVLYKSVHILYYITCDQVRSKTILVR